MTPNEIIEDGMATLCTDQAVPHRRHALRICDFLLGIGLGKRHDAD